LQQDIEQGHDNNLHAVLTLFDAAQMVGECMRDVMNHAKKVANNTGGSSFSSSFMLGGQIKGQPPELYMIYPEGNCIRATKDTPFFQLGESKYGKPILDRSVKYDTKVSHAARALMLSFDSTIHSNLSVGMPIDFVIYKNDSLTLPKGRRIDENDQYFNSLRHQWADALRQTLVELPACPDGYWG
jgi:putative proteasome-type protease